MFTVQGMPVSEPYRNSILAAGWYVGAVCKDPDCGGMIVPFDGYTLITMQRSENAQKCCGTLWNKGVFMKGKKYIVYTQMNKLGFKKVSLIMQKTLSNGQKKMSIC